MTLNSTLCVKKYRSKIMDIAVERKFNSYPENIKLRMLELRGLIFEVASELDDVGEIQETLKWGEPSYISKIGSTLRIDWKGSIPETCFMYFHCQTKLVDTFKELYGEELKFEGNRAIVLGLNEKLPKQILKHCISLCLRYHRVKNLPLLGA